MTRSATAPGVGQLDVEYVGGEQYEIDMRGHRFRVDQPIDAGGDNLAPTPWSCSVDGAAIP